MALPPIEPFAIPATRTIPVFTSELNGSRVDEVSIVHAGSNHDPHPTPFRGAAGHDTPTLAVLPAGLADRGISQAFRRHSPTNHSLGRGTEQPGVPACGQGSNPWY